MDNGDKNDMVRSLILSLAPHVRVYTKVYRMGSGQSLGLG